MTEPATASSLTAQLRARRVEMMVEEIEAIALGLFDARGFDAVTVEDIAREARVSVRTFYRYFPAKEAVLQVQLDRRRDALRRALAERPLDEPPLRSVRAALETVVAAEDPELLRRWISVIAATPSVVKGVLGGVQLKTQPVFAEFFASRLGVPADDFTPIVLAAAVGGVIQAAQTRWFLHGGDVVAGISEGIAVLERGIGTDVLRAGITPERGGR